MSDVIEVAKISLVYDKAINYAFQQNAIPVIKEFKFCNDGTARKNLRIKLTTEPAFAEPVEILLQGIAPQGEYRAAPLELKLRPNFLSELGEKISGLFKCAVVDGDEVICSLAEPVSLLARNEWCGLVSLPEILAAFVLPNDPAVMQILDRGAAVLREHTGQSAFNGYQDKNHRRAWEQVAAIYKAISELGIRYMVAPASFETTGQKVRTPTEIINQRFGNCLDLALLFCACCEQVGLHPLVLMHDGHAYAGCWLEEKTLSEPAGDDLQYIRKLAADDLLTVFECTTATSESPGTLKDAELLAVTHLRGEKPFRQVIDIHRARISRIHPLPIPGQAEDNKFTGAVRPQAAGIGERQFIDPVKVNTAAPARPASRIDQWKSRLLDLSLRNRLLNFRETKSAIQILSAVPEHVEDELAAERELALRPRPNVMGEDDPRNETTYTRMQRADALKDHLVDELENGRLHTNLEESEHGRRLTDLYRSAKNSIEENGSNTLFAAVGFLEWREAEHSDRVFRAPLLLVPVELKRKSVLEGFSLRRMDEETRLNVTLMEMLRQNFQKEIQGLDPLPEDQSGVDVGMVLRIFRDAVRDLPGWEVKSEVWLGQFSFTKFLLWKDLADRLDALIKNRVVNHLVNQAGMPYDNPSADIKPEQLDADFHPRDIFCPRSADSSQLAAVMAAAAGHDFVLEGPPGTGKSQTIANIIAHCLANRKRVLFVAEKRAALDVVYRRLREEGLEPFCLELHSNKTGKADVVAQFDRTLKLAEDGKHIDWDLRATELERLRDALNAYTHALHRRLPCGLSAHQCLDYLLPRQQETIVRLPELKFILETGAEILAQVREVAKLLQERSRILMPLVGHPLELLACEEWTPGWAENVRAQMREVGDYAQRLETAYSDLRQWLHCPTVNPSSKLLNDLAALVDSLLSPQPVGPAFATISWNNLSAQLDFWIKLIEERNQLRQKIEGMAKPATTGLPAVASESWSDAHAEEITKQCGEVVRLAEQAIAASRDLHTWIQFPRPAASRSDIAALVALVDSLISALPVGEQFARANWAEWVTDFDRWIALVRERVELRAKLKGYDEARLLALDLPALESKWQSASNTWFLPKWLGLSAVRKQLRQVRTDHLKPEDARVTEMIKSAIRLRVINTELQAAASKAEPLFGPVWSRGEPELEHLILVRSWGATLHERLAVLAGADAVWMEKLRALMAEMFRLGPSSYEAGTIIGKRLNRYRDAITQYDTGYETLVETAGLRRGPMEETADHLAAITSNAGFFQQSFTRIRRLNSELAASSASAGECLGTLWTNGEPKAEELIRAREWGHKFHASLVACAGDDLAWLGQMRQLMATLFAEGPEVYAAGTAIGNRLASYGEIFSKFRQVMVNYAEAVRLRCDRLDQSKDYLTTVRHHVEAVPKSWSHIREWCFWQKIRSEAMRLGLGAVVEKIESPGGETLDVPALFERSFRKELFFAAIEREPALREFFGREHNERIERFRNVDEQVSALAKNLIRARLTANIPRDQGFNDIPKAEIGLLRKEIGKKMRHIPVRQLLNRIPNLLPRLKPCVLMSPLSVAQYLEPNHAAFDVVIFDEASQIPVWDAVGAIARGQQLIVVGDPKQLPPTNFFNSNAEDEDSLAPEEFKDLESILDELMSNQFRQKRLQWHYRSRHESLITFSNRQYYDNELLTFPSAETASGGVKFRHLPEAKYDKGKSRTNRREAEALVAELVGRLRKTDGPERSYGVVTFSIAQQQLVENLLDEERRKYPEIEIHFGEDCPVEGEPVFVKNLENVQGDERDVIFFSICYGPDETGRVAMNFGPLNRDGGERRLNVAITRAKHEIQVFSGLRADQIELTRTRARGVRDLKYFLDYAERGAAALASAALAGTSDEADSEFEKMVADKLREAGYDVHHQVGCSGYRIDLGVVDQKQPGRYLLGVECDGATYHRAATARDRDKLRQAILEGLGWKLYRIWSTDWWHDAQGETQKLIKHIAALLK
ncbi:MAG: DUF4011 domain-containing protein [Verrucomicrobiota bacterium]